MGFKIWWFELRFKLDNFFEKIDSNMSSLKRKRTILLAKLLSAIIGEDTLFMAIDLKQSNNIKLITAMFSEYKKVILDPDKPLDVEAQKKFILEVEEIKNKTLKDLKSRMNWLR